MLPRHGQTTPTSSTSTGNTVPSSQEIGLEGCAEPLSTFQSTGSYRNPLHIPRAAGQRGHSHLLPAGRTDHRSLTAHGSTRSQGRRWAATPTSVPAGWAFTPGVFVGGTFTSSLPQANQPAKQGAQQHQAESHGAGHAVPTGAHCTRWNRAALPTSTSPLRVWTQPRGRATTSPLGCWDAQVGWGCRHSQSPPTPTCSEGSPNPSPGETPGSEHVAGGIICLGCRQT